MIKRTTNKMCLSMLLICNLTLNAQKDVTQFLGIPVDGNKTEMIKKLNSKGYTNKPYKKDILEGEFNGYDVNIHVVTNNNKVCRIMVADVNLINETDIRIRFNKLIEQFQSNKKYLHSPESTISNYIIPEDEDISYQMLVKNKRYEAIFYQKTADYDTLETEMINLVKNGSSNDTDKERLNLISKKMVDDSLNKIVWFMITESYGKYSITMYYDNEYNRANGEGL